VHLQSAVLDADVKLAFEQTPAPAVRLSGTVQISRVKLADAKDQDLLAFDRLQLGLADVRPLSRAVKLSSVELNQPLLTVHRARDGRLNVDLSAPPARDAKKSSKTVADKDRPTKEKKEKEASSSPSDAWKVDVASVAVRGGQVDWIDDTTAWGARRPGWACAT
jgi:uncharacterized protein involved in outer membrane biogenesis